MTVRERLEAAKSSSARGLASTSTAYTGFNFGGTGSRIAKPLRGGGGSGATNDVFSGNAAPTNPTLSSLQAQDHNSTSGSPGKRGSWFFDRR